MKKELTLGTPAVPGNEIDFASRHGGRAEGQFFFHFEVQLK